MESGALHYARKRLRTLIAAALTAAVGLALAASGGFSYASAAVMTPAGKAGATAAQYGERPGWGCGDRNHEHTGPPGRQYAPAPPGCTR
jgi:hypothetical protein